MTIFGISGYAQVGKDTVGGFLVDDHGFTRYAFADKLRQVMYALNPIVMANYGEPVRLAALVDRYGWDKTKLNFQEVRELLQRLGTDAGRKVLGENVWVDAVFNDITEEDVVITDVRFSNEAEAIKSRGGFIVRVKRPGVGAANAHLSETALDEWPFDYTVPNDATKEALQSSVKHLVKDATDPAKTTRRPEHPLPGYGSPVMR